MAAKSKAAKGATPAIRPITRLLVANRGEIARRIFRSAHDYGIATVAVFADGDARAPFVADADQAIALGGKSAGETYLDAERVIAAARRAGADAVHPGYGFLSENAGFAQQVIDAGLVWVGPEPSAIAAMGDKLEAKRLMAEAGVPTLEAVEIARDTDVRAKAREIGYPLLVKAAAGGGGRGMRVVASEDQLEAAVAGARREAKSAFGDDTVFLERYLERARHVEIQILGDRHGHLVHCFERECSIQRRHQKIIEEAPSPAVSPALRKRLGEAAVAAGRAIGYSSAGTVELLLLGDEFWFLEVNTRLQVEHPVTEAITGLDLVREQLRIAQGEELGFTQDDLAISGHAIEARLYAEDPENDFLPATGRLVAFEPPSHTQARFDSGVESGSVVGIEFDPMLAKVITHAPTRREAAARLARVLETTRIQGLVTNRDFLVAVLRTPEFLAGDTTTDFIDRVQPARRRAPGPGELAEAALVAALWRQHQRRVAARVQTTIPSGFRNTVMPPEEVLFHTDDPSGSRQGRLEARVEYRIRRDGTFWARTHVGIGGSPGDGEEHVVTVCSATDQGVELEIDGRRIRARVTVDGRRYFVHGPAGDLELEALSRFPKAERAAVTGELVAPMPGRVISTLVSVGDQVEAGQLLLVLEAMKMEHRMTAPEAGVVAELPVVVGDQVANGQLLVVVAPTAKSEAGSEGT